MCFLHKTTGFYLANSGTELMENRTRWVYKYASTDECQAQVTDSLLALTSVQYTIKCITLQTLKSVILNIFIAV